MKNERITQEEQQLTKRQRHLPHWEQGGSVYHIVFRLNSECLTPESRQLVLDTIRHDTGRRFRLYVAVVMPDHVHLLLQPLENEHGEFYSLSEITGLLKGVSAHKINKLMNTTGQVWQDESYDHIIRNEAEFNDQAEYIFLNPVRKGLISDPIDYPYLVIPQS